MGRWIAAPACKPSRWTPQMQTKAEVAAASGVSLKEIGTMLGVSPETVRYHLIPGTAEAHYRRVLQRTRQPGYRAWLTMIQRCRYSWHKSYPNYGARGVKVCDRWRTYKNWYEDFGQFKPGPSYSMDRIDNDGDYEPGNVRWATRKEQARNTRSNVIVSYRGERMTLPEAAELSGINYSSLWARYHRGDRGDYLFRPVDRRFS